MALARCTVDASIPELARRTVGLTRQSDTLTVLLTALPALRLKSSGCRQKTRQWTGGFGQAGRPTSRFPHGPSRYEGLCGSE